MFHDLPSTYLTLRVGRADMRVVSCGTVTVIKAIHQGPNPLTGESHQTVTSD